MQPAYGDQRQQPARCGGQDEGQHPQQSGPLVCVAPGADAVQVDLLGKHRRQRGRRRCEQHERRDDGQGEREPQERAVARHDQRREREAKQNGPCDDQRVAGGLAQQEVADADR